MRHSLCVLCAAVLCVFALCAVSCTQSKLELINSIVCPVFAFETESSYASCRLCAYVQTRSEPGYLRMMQIDSENTGYRWNVSQLQYIYSSNGKWAGSSSMYMPRGAALPEGKVRLTAINADSQTVERTFNLDYPKKLLSIDYKTFLSSEDYQKLVQQYIVFYDAEGAVVNCELIKPEKNNQEKDVPEAATSRNLFVARDKSFAVLSPAKALAEKAQKK